MRLAIEIIAALLLVLCVSVPSAAFAGGLGQGADRVSCTFSVPQKATPAPRCMAIKKQCGGKFYANYCGDKMLADM
ncbi:hypothetical protein [Bradyrhizobium sp. ARR65]|uniref:hypothetical protein n=1 Tax=Bradyrhizobium sp. ARR65 TaxID=1040989 RepID=UPI0004662383|nr:hypothetical protein [Bradyrhizobium sp. ARR65]